MTRTLGVFISSSKDKSGGKRRRARGSGSLWGDKTGSSPLAKWQVMTRQAESLSQQRQVTFKRPEKTMWLWSQNAQIQTLALPSTSCVTVDKVFSLSVPQFLICEMDIIITLPPVLAMNLQWVYTHKSLRAVSGTHREHYKCSQLVF